MSRREIEIDPMRAKLAYDAVVDGLSRANVPDMDEDDWVYGILSSAATLAKGKLTREEFLALADGAFETFGGELAS